MTDLFKQYKEALLEKHCMVTFKKVSGDERKMKCTLRKRRYTFGRQVGSSFSNKDTRTQY